MEEIPEIKPESALIDKVLEIGGWIFILTIWCLIVVSYHNLPDTIATHYNGVGKADGFGSMETILILPILATVFFAMFTLLNRVLHLLIRITNENAQRQYVNIARYIRYLKLVIVLPIGMIVLKTVQNPDGQPGLGAWFLPLFLGCIFIPNIYFIVQIAKSN